MLGKDKVTELTSEFKKEAITFVQAHGAKGNLSVKFGANYVTFILRMDFPNEEGKMMQPERDLFLHLTERNELGALKPEDLDRCFVASNNDKFRILGAVGNKKHRLLVSKIPSGVTHKVDATQVRRCSIFDAPGTAMKEKKG